MKDRLWPFLPTAVVVMAYAVIFASGIIVAFQAGRLIDLIYLLVGAVALVLVGLAIGTLLGYDFSDRPSRRRA